MVSGFFMQAFLWFTVYQVLTLTGVCSWFWRSYTTLY